MSNRITHLYLFGVLDTADDIAHITRTELLTGNHVHLQYTHLISIIFHSRIEELHLVTFANGTVLNLEIGNDAAEGVEHGVEDQCLQWCFRISLGTRDSLHHSIQHILHAFTGLTACADNIFTVAPYQFYDLILHLIGHSTGHVYLVDDGDDLQVMVYGHVQV